MKLHELARKKRIELEMTQSDLAKKLGYSCSQFISNWENGRVSIPMKRINDICTILQLDPVKIIDIFSKEKLETLRKKWHK